MLAYKYRFHGHGSLRYLYAKGETTRNHLLQIRYVPNKKRSDSRATVIVAKKVLKSAVKRNRIRRRVYEILRRNWDSIVHPVDFAVSIFMPEAATMPADELEANVLSVLTQAGLYQSRSQSDKIN